MSKKVDKKHTESYQVFKRPPTHKENIKHNFHSIVGLPDSFHGDLAFFTDLKSKNDGIEAMLILGEVTSRYAYVYPMKNKTAATVNAAFRSFLTAHGNVRHLNTDPGSEFISASFKK